MIPDDLERKIVRLHLVEGWPVGTIAKQCEVHHSTVRRVLHTRGVPAAPTTRTSMADPFMPFILETLKEHPNLPASRLHHMVVERGYPGGPDHFRRLVARLRPRKPAEAFQRLRTLPGEQAQVDWGHFGTRVVGRATRPVCAFVIVLSWSRMPFVQFFYNLRMDAFLTGHEAAFRFFGGVPRTLLFDNLKSVVTERRADAIRFNPTFLDFAAHHRFEPRPVAIARGNEKGRVERTIRYLRTSFWPAREWSDLDDLNAQVIDWCRGVAAQRPCPGDPDLTVQAAFELEQPRLLPLADDGFPLADRAAARVGKTPYARYDRNDYSVPHDRVRRSVTVLATPARVRILDGDQVIAEHDRTYDKGAQVEDPEHSRALTEAKAAARAARGMDQLHHAVPSSAVLLEGAARRGHNLGSAVAGLLRLVQTWGADRVEVAVKEALGADRLHVHAVRQILERHAEDEREKPPIAVALSDEARARDVVVKPHALSSYDLEGEDG